MTCEDIRHKPGLLPDFIPDMENVGVSAEKLGALFCSAEDYIQMWERWVKRSQMLTRSLSKIVDDRVRPTVEAWDRFSHFSVIIAFLSDLVIRVLNVIRRRGDG